MDEDIKKLIDKFMDGMTSLEEEDRIAEYFRTHATGDEWKPYKEMFAWFDEGMPMEKLEPESRKPQRKYLRTVLKIVCSAAAAVALILLVTLPSGKEDLVAVKSDNVQENRNPAAVPDSTLNNVTTDSTNIELVKRRKIRKKLKKHYYEVAPPKVYLADAEKDSITQMADMLAEQELIKVTNRQNEMLRAIDSLCVRHGQSIDMMVASLDDYDYDYEETETVTYE